MALKKTPAKKAGAVKKAGAAEKTDFRVRVRMYRHGLGDCFLITFRRNEGAPFQMLIDCGALERGKADMQRLAKEISKTVPGPEGKPRLDVLVGTHQHRDHLSGFNQARAEFDKIEVGAVWLSWLENLTDSEAEELRSLKKKAIETLKKATDQTAKLGPDNDVLAGARKLLGLHDPGSKKSSLDEGKASVVGAAAPLDGDDPKGTRTISQAMAYLKNRGGLNLKYLNPGDGPLKLQGVEGVRVYVLGPPHDPALLKGSEVTKKHVEDGVIFHMGEEGLVGMDALAAALPTKQNGVNSARYSPFAEEHAIREGKRYYRGIQPYLDATYHHKDEAWRRIELDWMDGFNQLALDLDNDTNNTSLVLAFEMEDTGEVLLFVGDAQVGNWLSWEKVSFDVGQSTRITAHDLLRRTVFYKVGHHCSHNATLDKGGLRLMTSDKLVAFIPLDKSTAAKQGKCGWAMPAEALFASLNLKAKNRVVISDVNEKIPKAAKDAGVRAGGNDKLQWVDYYVD